MGDQRAAIIAVSTCLMALTLGAICSRVSRRLTIGSVAYHDVFISMAAIFAFIFSICLCVGTTYGLGQHLVHLSEEQYHKLLKLMYISNVFYFACNWFVKHALLIFYSEIVQERKYQVSIYIMHFIAFGFGLSSILVNVFQCTPTAKAYTPFMDGHCVNMNFFFYTNSSIMLATDLVLYIMPVVFTWNLRLRKAQRIGVNCLFGLGILVLLASAGRVIACHYFATKPDFPWWFSLAMILSTIENHIAIFVACAPSIKVILLLIFPRLISSYRKVLSKVSPTRSTFDSHDLENGAGKSDKLRSTWSSTPLSSPGATIGSRRNDGLFQFLRGSTSPRRFNSSDSMDDSLMATDTAVRKEYHVQMINITGKDDEKSHRPGASPNPDNDIRIQHTIEVESARQSQEDRIKVIKEMS